MRKREHQVKFRLTDQELQIFNNHLNASNLKQNEFLRRVALDKPIVVVTGLEDYIKELRSVGNNVNQLARAVNTGKMNAREETAELVEEVRKLWLTLRLLKAKGKV